MRRRTLPGCWRPAGCIMPETVPLIEPRGLWVGLLFLALLAVYLWADRKWPGH